MEGPSCPANTLPREALLDIPTQWADVSLGKRCSPVPERWSRREAVWAQEIGAGRRQSRRHGQLAPM